MFVKTALYVISMSSDLPNIEYRNAYHDKMQYFLHAMIRGGAGNEGESLLVCGPPHKGYEQNKKDMEKPEDDDVTLLGSLKCIKQLQESTNFFQTSSKVPS